MNARRDDEAETAGLLRAASAEYGDLPTDVADRMDRVLDQLPTADTLHRREERAVPDWIERLRARRLRYALVSATAALLVTVGAVAVAVQVVSTSDEKDGDAAVLADEAPSSEFGESDSEEEAVDEAPGAAEDDFGVDGAPQEEETEGVDESGTVEVFATGTDYGSGVDLLTELRGLGSGSTSGAVPEELAGLAEGGLPWENCQEAIAGRYDSLIVAADFAHFESAPAIVALLVSDAGEMAVALTPACGNGIIEELSVQE